MPRLSKNMYTSQGERKLNCYNIAIPKSIVSKAQIDDKEELKIYAEYGKIIITPKNYYVCMECGLEWQSCDTLYDTTICPRCHCSDIDICERNND